jgi:hypothetical protein
MLHHAQLLVGMGSQELFKLGWSQTAVFPPEELGLQL